MKCELFRSLTPAGKKNVIKNLGEILFIRNEAEEDIVLYQLDGFYVEVSFARHQPKEIEFRAFDNTDELEPYLMMIDISTLFTADHP